jgi:YD repeat-containing protein
MISRTSRAILLEMANSVSRQKSGLQGRVRSVRTEVMQFVRERGRLIEKRWYHSTVWYDSEGYPTEQSTHNPNGTETRVTYVYDPAGRLSEMRGQVDGISTGRTVYLYDAEGRLSYELSLGADGSEGRQTRRFYEADGSYTEEFTVDREPGVPVSVEDPDNAISAERASFIRTRRDAAGQPLEMRFYDASGGLLYRFVYHYNVSGVLTDMEQRTGDQPLFEIPSGTELAAGLLGDFGALFSPDTAISTVRYRYDEQDRRIEAATWMGATCIDRRTFAYDERGDKQTEQRYGADGKLQADIVYEREYDERGNWVLERTIEAGVATTAARRTIAYE